MSTAFINANVYLWDMELSPLNNILVIDEFPLIAIGLQEVFRRQDPSVSVVHTENIFTALSSPRLAEEHFSLIVLDPKVESSWDNLRQSIYELKERFAKSKVMIYSKIYDHLLIEKMDESGIDAYVHKYEDIRELVQAFSRLRGGERYISGILYTLYYEYHWDTPRDAAGKTR